MVGKNDRISDMCLYFARNESNENVRISYSITNSGSVDVYVVFTFLENWNKQRSTFILRQLIQQFKLDMVGFSLYNFFVSQRYSFDDGEYRGNTIFYSIPFDPDKFPFENLQCDYSRYYDSSYYYKYYNWICLLIIVSSSMSFIKIIYSGTSLKQTLTGQKFLFALRGVRLERFELKSSQI